MRLPLAPSLRRALLITALWRLAILGWGAASHFLISPSPHLHSLLRHGWPVTWWSLALDPGIRHDAYWYVSIARHGYTYSTHHLSSIGFFPLYPLTIWLATRLVGNPYLAGTLLSTLFLLLAVLSLHSWMEKVGWEGRTPLTVLLLLSYPFAFIFAAVYSESLFLWLSITAFAAGEDRRWGYASFWTALAVLTRPTGYILLPCLALLAVRRGRRAIGVLLPIGAGLAALACFSLYQQIVFGTPFAYFRAKSVPPWAVSLHQALADLTLQGRPGIPPWFLTFNLMIGLLFLLALPLIYRRLGLAYVAWDALTVLSALAGAIPGLQRYVTTIFPAFAALATLRHPRLLFVLILIGFDLQAFFLTLWVGGYGVF